MHKQVVMLLHMWFITFANNCAFELYQGKGRTIIFPLSFILHIYVFINVFCAFLAVNATKLSKDGLPKELMRFLDDPKKTTIIPVLDAISEATRTSEYEITHIL